MMNEEKYYYTFIKKEYRFLAFFYDIITIPFYSIRNKIVNFVNPKKDSKVLDIATGTGGQVYAFLKKGYKAIGIDLSKAMIKIAKKKNRHLKANFLIGDSKNLPFKDNSFDISPISFALHEMPFSIREKTLKEIVRVNNSNGLIIIVEFSLTKMIFGRLLINYFIKLFEGKFYSEFIKSDFNGLLRKNGIEIIEEIPIMSGAIKILKGKKKAFNS